MWAPKFAFDPDGRHDDWEADDDARRAPITATAMLRGALTVGAVAFLIFLLVPGLDLAVGRLFYIGDRQFVGRELLLIPAIRLAFNIFFYSICALTLIGLVMAARNAEAWLGLTFSRWMFLALCLITGPLVIANIGLKDHWGRARPRDVVEFSGAKAFSAPFPPSGQCDYNCSFVSGEASSIFIVLFAAALLFKSRSRNLVAAGIVLGSLAGLVRMAQGGHFLSDVVFAGVFMAMTAAGIQLLFEALESERMRPVEQNSA
jgi:lipid A 4'-phosphatase